MYVFVATGDSAIGSVCGDAAASCGDAVACVAVCCSVLQCVAVDAAAPCAVAVAVARLAGENEATVSAIPPLCRRAPLSSLPSPTFDSAAPFAPSPTHSQKSALYSFDTAHLAVS